VPEVLDKAQAARDPELAVLSAIAHGKDADFEKAGQIAAVAQQLCHTLDADRA
jgi:hypothetical protein